MTRPDFREVADRVWVARHEWLDVNVTVIGGQRGCLLVDTLGSARAAEDMLVELDALGVGDVLGVVNTHEHFDHTFGNGAVRARWRRVPLIAHEEAAARTHLSGELAKAQYAGQADDPHAADVLATTVVPADDTFSSVRAVDLGDRVVDLVHPGRGHTGGDVVVRVEGADVVVAGDLVEESAPPSYGPDCHPLDWPATLDLVLGLVSDATVVVPGHGGPVDRAFVQQQRADIGVVAETVHDLASRSVPLEEALRHPDWPFERDRLEHAVRRGYEQVPRTARRLPLL